MELFFDGYFYNPTRGNLTPDEVLDEVLGYMQEKPDSSYEVIVGCDSSSKEEPTFPVVLVVLRTGEGGRFFLKKISYKNKKFYNLHQRILEEVLLSCDLALFLRGTLEKRIKESKVGLKYQFIHIHADIGGSVATREMVREVTGLIRGNGFEPKIKPESFVASVVADRYS